MVAKIVSKRKINLRETMLDLLKNDPFLAPRFKNAVALEKPIGYGLPLASRKRKTFGDGWILVGDSASMINPSSGEGIGTAMISGLIAADFLEKAVATGRFDEGFFKNFDREIYRRLHGEIAGYNFLMAMKPEKLWDIGTNLMMHFPWMRAYFNYFYPKWVKTGFEKPVEVDV
jgi:flavin-dependent dehydrogenase